MILTYIFNLPEADQKNSPFIPKSVALLPHLLNSLKLFSTDTDNREAYLDDEDYSELIVSIIEVVVTTATEKHYKDILN